NCKQTAVPQDCRHHFPQIRTARERLHSRHRTAAPSRRHKQISFIARTRRPWRRCSEQLRAKSKGSCPRKSQRAHATASSEKYTVSSTLRCVRTGNSRSKYAKHFVPGALTRSISARWFLWSPDARGRLCPAFPSGCSTSGRQRLWLQIKTAGPDNERLSAA